MPSKTLSVPQSCSVSFTATQRYVKWHHNPRNRTSSLSTSSEFFATSGSISFIMISCSWIGCGWQATVPKRTFAPKRGVGEGISKLRKMKSCIICTFQQQYKGKGCTNPGYLVALATKFHTMAPNIFSFVKKICINTRTPSTKREITVRFWGHSVTP